MATNDDSGEDSIRLRLEGPQKTWSVCVILQLNLDIQTAHWSERNL